MNTEENFHCRPDSDQPKPTPPAAPSPEAMKLLALNQAAERLRVCSRRFEEMGNGSFSAVVLEWYRETSNHAKSL